jgi:hypothetical protein
MGHAREGAAQVMRNAFVADGETAHMGFVNEGLRPGDFGLPVAFPIKRGVDHDALEHIAGVIAGIERQIRVAMADLITAVFITQVE